MRGLLYLYMRCIHVVLWHVSGLITVAHDSGGPKLDIVVPWEGRATGLLASTAPSYATALHGALLMGAEERARMQGAARASAGRFRQQRFEGAFGAAVGGLMRPFMA